MHKRSNFPIYVLIGFISIISLFTAYRSNIDIEKITDTSLINLPPTIKEQVINDRDSEYMYVRYRDGKMQYYHISINENRRAQLIKLMKKFAISIRYNIPEGDYLLTLHDGIHHDPEIPVIAFSSTKELVKNNKVVLMPDPDSITGYSYNFKNIDKNISKYPWYKKAAIIFWRGSATGAGWEANNINASDRLRFLNYVKDLPYVDAAFTEYTGQMNPKMNALVQSVHKLKPYVRPEHSLGYKYLIDIDGNSCSYARMAWILYSNSVLMKHMSDKMQWYYPKMQPYVHYIPINNDFSNLKEQFDWAEANQDKAREIAANGRKLASQVFSKEGIIKGAAESFQRYHALMLENQQL